jgi:mannose-6-phosphate isomerase
MNLVSADGPIFFKRNRVNRVYRGGLLFHDFFGDQPEDGFKPEEWIASTVRALNRDSRDPLEGISILEDSDMPFTEFLSSHSSQESAQRSDLGILVKVLDSAIRLPVQTHPDKPFARRYFRSNHGKTEMWIVLATRENAHIYFGFRQPLTKKQLLQAIEASERDPTALPQLLNEVVPTPGDVYLIHPRLVHAIGAGCLILEVQEPTDFTIQPEAWCGDYRLNDHEKYLGLDQDIALECFDLQDLVGERAIRAARKTPRVFRETEDLRAEHLISGEDTTDFSVNRYRLRAGSLRLEGRPGVYVVTSGTGSLLHGDSERPIAKGSYFFLPAAAAQTVIRTNKEMEIVESLPPSV